MTAGATAPVAFFGFDAAEPALVERGIADGTLPTMRRLVEEGQAVLLSPPPSGFYNTSWIATVTGADVDEHRAVIDRQLEPGSYRIVDMRPNAIERPPFWRYLSDVGLASTIAGIYSSPSLSGFRGSQVHGWGSIDPYWVKFDEQAFDPPELERLLAQAVPSRQAFYRSAKPHTAAEYHDHLNRLLRSVEEQTSGLTTLLDNTRWDFFFGSYGEPHYGGHLLWHLSDPEHPLYDAGLAEELGDSIMALYRAVDRGIGELIERVPPGTRCFVVTPHGMRPNYVHDPAEQILARSGWLVTHAAGSGGSIRGRALRGAWSAGRRIIPTRVRLAARSRLSDDGLLATMPLAHIDWSKTSVFALPSDMTSYLRVNLAGREPDGIVQPGEEYDRVCNEVRQLFEGLRHAGTGVRAVERVVRCDQAFGEVVGSLPDLCVVWADEQQVRSLDVPGFGSIDLRFDDPRTGQHRHLGFLVGAGPGIAPSGSRSLGGQVATLLDVAPTALTLLDVDAGMLRGRPIDVFTSGSDGIPAMS
jgi:predicted AlkP superfamily phosphohydrolase/phosphomutase